MPVEPAETIRQNFIHLCNQYNVMGELLIPLAATMPPNAYSKPAKAMAAVLDQHQEMGEQLKTLCHGLEGMVDKLLDKTPPLTRDPNDN